ncbi:MAG: four helix bundle protein [Bdellovibrionota bacterium]
MKTNFKTYELAVELYDECERLKLQRVVRDQLQRASLSAVLNLAEGAAKPTQKDKRKFYAIAYGSIREMQAIFRVVRNRELFAKADQLGGAAYRLMQATR